MVRDAKTVGRGVKRGAVATGRGANRASIRIDEGAERLGRAGMKKGREGYKKGVRAGRIVERETKRFMREGQTRHKVTRGAKSRKGRPSYAGKKPLEPWAGKGRPIPAWTKKTPKSFFVRKKGGKK